MIIAKKIDSNTFTYECPHCRTKLGKPKMHQHGSENDIRNRVENRLADCNGKNIEIHITDATKRNL